VLLQDGEDVLEKVELFIARAGPEIVAMNDKRLFFFVAGEAMTIVMLLFFLGSQFGLFSLFRAIQISHLDM
jgi:hypothetical protein